MSIFPETADLPQSAAKDTIKYGFGKSFLFDFEKGDFVLRDGKAQVIDDIPALKVWIEKILRTKRDEYKIYENTPYGSRFDDLVVGSIYPPAFIDSELRREVEDALTQNPRIITVSDFTVDRSASNCAVSFTVTTAAGLTLSEVVKLV
jgi:phage baseplate assembly protein W